MRKLLLGTTALAAATAMSTAALADVSISGGYEFKYKSVSSSKVTKDGTTFSQGDNDLVLTFTNKTDSGLNLTYRYDIGSIGSDGAGLTGDENSLSIAGGFGKVVLGTDDDASDAYNIDEMDLIAEEPTYAMASSSIGTSSSVSSSDAIKVAYHLPAMGGLTTGISYADSGEVGATDTTAYGLRYTMDAAGASVTVGYANKTTEAATKDTDQTNMGLKVVSGDLSMIISQGTYEAVDEDRENQGASLSYKLPNGMTIGAYTFKSEDTLDAGEEYTRNGAEVQYTIASGLTAVINVDNYEYKHTASTHESATGTHADDGTQTQLTLKAAF